MNEEIFPVGYFRGKENMWEAVRKLKIFDFRKHSKETFYELKDKIVNFLKTNDNLFMTTAPLDRKLRPIFPYLFDEVLNRDGDFDYKTLLFNEILDIGCNNFQKNEFNAIYHEFIRSTCEITSRNVHTEVMNGDTVLSFALKYGDYTHKEFPRRIESLLRKSNRLRVNYEGRLPLDVLIFRIKTHKEFKECCSEVEKKLRSINKENKIDRHRTICEMIKDYIQKIEDRKDKTPIIKNVLEIIEHFEKEPKQDCFPLEEQKQLERKTFLFECIVQDKLNDFHENLTECDIDLNDGEYNLLQCSCYIPYREKFVDELIDKGASPLTNTKISNLSPLEVSRALRYPCIILAAIADLKDKNEEENCNEGIFDKVQHCKENNYELTPIDFVDMQFYKCQGTVSLENFYKLTVLKINEEVFPILTQRCIRQNDPIGLKILLNKGWSLLDKDCDGKTVLDHGVAPVLKDYMDSCIFIKDKEERKLHYTHKLDLDFSFISNDHVNNYNETQILQKMTLNNQVSKLLFDHPLIDSFINIKWSMVQPFFSVFILVKILVHIWISYYFLHEVVESTNSKNEKKTWYIALVVTCILSCLLSYPLINIPSLGNMNIIQWNWFDHPLKFIISMPSILCLIIYVIISKFIETIKLNNMHLVFEILGCICFIYHYFTQDLTFASFSYVFMSLSLILSMGYHPKVSKVTAMLKKVYSSFFLMFLFFTSTFLLSYIFGFRVIFKKNELFGSLSNATITTLIMMSGEINADNTIQKSDDIWQKIFGITFIIGITIVLTNFIIAVFVEMANVEKIKEDYRLTANMNTLQFMILCERYHNCIYTRWFIQFIARILKHLLINDLFDGSMENWPDSFSTRLNYPYIFDKSEKNRILTCKINNIHLSNLFEDHEKFKYVRFDYYLWEKLRDHKQKNNINFHSLIDLIKHKHYEDSMEDIMIT